MIQFGLYNSVASPPAGEAIVRAVAEAIREAEVAEAAGFDGCFVGEHHQDPKGFLPSPMMLLSAIAARTTRLKVGTGVLLLPLHAPYRVAEYAATLDVISNGRAILGVGAGYQANDFAPFGVAVQDRGTVMDESLGVVRALLEQERVTHRGARFSLDNVTVTPRPVQTPRPEIWVTGWSPAGIRRAARHGDRWFPDSLQHLSIVTRLVETYRAEVQKHGGVPRVALFRDAWVASTRAAAFAEYGEIMLPVTKYYWTNGAYNPADPVLSTIKAEADITLERMAEDRLIIGSPADCIAQVRRWNRAVGADYFVLRFRQAHAGGPPHAAVCRAIELFGAEVVRPLRDTPNPRQGDAR
jgi:probable F420-dependent oxidoreductase